MVLLFFTSAVSQLYWMKVSPNHSVKRLPFNDISATNATGIRYMIPNGTFVGSRFDCARKLDTNT